MADDLAALDLDDSDDRAATCETPAVSGFTPTGEGGDEHDNAGAFVAALQIIGR